MAILFRKHNTARSVLKTALARHSSDTAYQRKCPACATLLRVSETGKDRTSYVCDKCNEVSTFTIGPPPNAPKEHTTRMGSITLRDRSTTKGYKRNDPEYKPTRDVSVALDVLRDSMKNKVIVGFQYTSSDGTVSMRSVEPYKLTLQGGAPVLYGYDVEACSIRVFKLESVDTVVAQTFTFKPRWPMDDKLLVKDPVDAKTD